MPLGAGPGRPVLPGVREMAAAGCVGWGALPGCLAGREAVRGQEARGEKAIVLEEMGPAGDGRSGRSGDGRTGRAAAAGAGAVVVVGLRTAAAVEGGEACGRAGGGVGEGSDLCHLPAVPTRRRRLHDVFLLIFRACQPTDVMGYSSTRRSSFMDAAGVFVLPYLDGDKEMVC